MGRINRIVTSEIEASNLSPSDPVGDRTYAYDTNGKISYYGQNRMLPVIEPGIIYGANKDSGDGERLNTIKLYPNAELVGTPDDRYLIIDPTNPNHIHIRAGGTQDESNAELYLGAEFTNVRVTDGNGTVSISTKEDRQVMAHLNLNSEASDTLLTGDVVSAVPGWTVEVNGVMYYIQDVQVGEGTTIYAPGAPFQPNGVYNFFSPINTHNWIFGNDGFLYGPEEGALKVSGIYSPGAMQVVSDGDMTISSNTGNMNFYMDGAAYIGPSVSENRIAQIKDLENRVSPAMIRYQPTFAATGLTFTGTGETYPTYNSYYTKAGKMVSFVIEVDLSTVTNFGTGQYTLELPFDPAIGYNHFSGWAQVDVNVNPDVPNGHVILNADHAGITSTLDLHYLKQAGGAHTPIIEGLFMQGTPVTLTTSSKIYINGTYIAA